MKRMKVTKQLTGCISATFYSAINCCRSVVFYKKKVYLTAQTHLVSYYATRKTIDFSFFCSLLFPYKGRGNEKALRFYLTW